MCDPEINSGQAATLRLNAAMKVELSNERGKKCLIELLQLGSKKIPLLFNVYRESNHAGLQLIEYTGELEIWITGVQVR